MWKQLLRNGYRKTSDMASRLGIELDPSLEEVERRYPFFVNEYYASLIGTGGADDPIAQMAIPDVDEMMAGGSEDTSGESSNTVVPGMQHKYRRNDSGMQQECSWKGMEDRDEDRVPE